MFKYSGTVVYALAAAQIKKVGSLSEKEQNDLNDGVKEMLKDPNVKQATYKGDGRYKIEIESRKKTGESLNMFDTFSVNTDENGVMTISSLEINEKSQMELEGIGISVDGLFKVYLPKNAEVISHNATSTPMFFGMFGGYSWKIGRIDQRPMMKVKIIPDMASKKQNDTQTIYTTHEKEVNTFKELGATVLSMRFYESGEGDIPLVQRRYQKKFMQSDARFINCELKLSYPRLGNRVEFPIKVDYYNPDNTIFVTSSYNGLVEAGWTSSFHNLRNGPNYLGKWPIGVYRVQLSIDGEVVSSGSFEMISPEPQLINKQEFKSSEMDEARRRTEHEQPRASMNPSQTTSSTSVALPTIQVGDSYVYEYIDTDNPESSTKTKRTVISIGDKVVLSVVNINAINAKKRTLYFNNEWNLLSTRNADNTGFDYSPPLKYFDFPLYPGKTWQQTTTETNIKTGATRTHKISGNVGQWENISGPAGVFNTIKVILKTDLIDPATAETINGTDTSWYAPDIRRTVKSITTGNNGKNQLIQLISYELK